MINPEARASIQPQPSEKGKKLGGLRGRFATATLFVGGLALAGTASPTPAEAGGGRMLVTASSEGTNCLEGESVLVTDLVYAAKLIEGIASGEIVIAIAGVPIAALNEGDKTAVTKPITITPDEIWANLAKPAPACPPVVEPTPTPEPISRVKLEVNDLKKLTTGYHPKISISKISREIVETYENDETATAAFIDFIGYTPEELTDICKNTRAREERIARCTNVVQSLLISYGITGNPAYLNLTDDYIDSILNMKGMSGKIVNKYMQDQIVNLKDWYPDLFK